MNSSKGYRAHQFQSPKVRLANCVLGEAAWSILTFTHAVQQTHCISLLFIYLNISMFADPWRRSKMTP